MSPSLRLKDLLGYVTRVKKEEKKKKTPGQLSRSGVEKWFRGGIVFKAQRLLHHSTLGFKLIKKKKRVPGQRRNRRAQRCRVRVHAHPATSPSNRLLHCLDLHHELPDSGERLLKTRTCKRRFAPISRAEKSRAQRCRVRVHAHPATRCPACVHVE
jgi:hypothetical protein